MLETTILEHIRQLPESLQQEVLHYTQFLLANHTQPSPVRKKRQSGFLKGTFTLPLSADFDEPLDDLKEYME
jgi:Protein of unknown function (DUF2281)